MTYLLRASCSTGITEGHAGAMPHDYCSPVSVLVGAHASFLLTQSFLLLFETKIEFIIIPFPKFLPFSNFDLFLKCWSMMLNRVVPNALEMRG